MPTKVWVVLRGEEDVLLVQCRVSGSSKLCQETDDPSTTNTGFVSLRNSEELLASLISVTSHPVRPSSPLVS